MEKKILENGGIELRDYRDLVYISPLKREEKESFGVVLPDPVLLHPSIIDKKLNEYERYNIRNSPFCYDGTHKGQYVLGLIFHSVEELFKYYIELRKRNYNRVRINKISNKVLEKKLFNINNCEELSFSGVGNILTVQIKETEFYKYKKDLLEIGLKNGYRYFWGAEDLFKNTTKVLRSVHKTIIE